MDKYNGLAIPPSMAFESVGTYALAYLLFMGDNGEQTATPSQWRMAQKLANHWEVHYNRDGSEIIPNPSWSVASWAMKLAGGVWTRPACTHKQMDVVLAREFAHVLEEKDKQDCIAFQDALATARKAAAMKAVKEYREQQHYHPYKAKCAICGTVAESDTFAGYQNYECVQCGATAHVHRDGPVLSLTWGFNIRRKTATEIAMDHLNAKAVLDRLNLKPEFIDGGVQWMPSTPVEETNTEPVCPSRSETLLQEAERLTSSDRRALYGSSTDNFERIAAAFNALTKRDLRPEEVGIFNLVQKLSRECHHHKRDNFVDIAGYANITQQVHDEKGDSAMPSPDSVKKVG